MKARSWFLTLVTAISAVALLATPAEAGGKKKKKYYRHGWNDGGYTYYQRGWSDRGYRNYRPYGYYRPYRYYPPPYYGPVYYEQGPVFGFQVEFR
jgi:hypothetical protein